jgi:lysophospholipase L1-like esterase
LVRKFNNSRVPPGYFLENLDQIVKLSNRKKFNLIFYIPYVIHPVYRRFIWNVARENNIPVVDFGFRHQSYNLGDLIANPVYSQLLSKYRKNLGDSYLNQHPIYLVTTDGIHPNALGNRIISERMAQVILKYENQGGL